MQRIDLGSSSYPPLLAKIHAPPQQLYVRGVFNCARPLVAIVGTRKITTYGKQVLHALIPPLVRSGIGIVSGLAYGVDVLAHTITLESGGHTIAVVPGGCDDASIYPQHNLRTAHAIINSGGAVISESPPGSHSPKYSFPKRNRIIAGLCVLTIVIEAAEKSGSKITANHALEYNRMVGAVPGSVFNPMSAGCNQLISQGAFVITSAQDVLELLGLGAEAFGENVPKPFQKMYAFCKADARRADEMAQALDLPHPEILRTITAMEIEGFLKDIGGKRFISI